MSGFSSCFDVTSTLLLRHFVKIIKATHFCSRWCLPRQQLNKEWCSWVWNIDIQLRFLGFSLYSFSNSDEGFSDRSLQLVGHRACLEGSPNPAIRSSNLHIMRKCSTRFCSLPVRLWPSNPYRKRLLWLHGDSSARYLLLFVGHPATSNDSFPSNLKWKNKRPIFSKSFRDCFYLFRKATSKTIFFQSNNLNKPRQKNLHTFSDLFFVLSF